MPVPEPGLSAVASFARGTRAISFSLDQLDLFVHGRVVDTARLAKEYGFTPRSTAEAFDDFIRSQQEGAVLRADEVRAAEKRILDGIRQARSAIGDGE